MHSQLISEPLRYLRPSSYGRRYRPTYAHSEALSRRAEHRAVHLAEHRIDHLGLVCRHLLAFAKKEGSPMPHVSPNQG